MVTSEGLSALPPDVTAQSALPSTLPSRSNRILNGWAGLPAKTGKQLSCVFALGILCLYFHWASTSALGATRSITSVALTSQSELRELIAANATNATPLLIFLLLAFATFVTEDLTCIWAGALIAEGRISFALGVAGCLVGIFVGDLLLFLSGRILGRRALTRAPVKWFVSELAVERGSLWFQRRGMATIALSRFMPGTRLPTYVAAGLLDTNFWKFTLYFFLAAAVWTPLLVAASMIAGREVIESALVAEESLFLRGTIIVVAVFIVVRVALQVSTFRGRRLLVGRWRRLTRWEFWPMWFFYPPVVIYNIYLGIRFRSLTLFTAANPAIEGGGFAGESKHSILSALNVASSNFVPLTGLLQVDGSSMFERARQFIVQNSLSYPIVLKPDAGERGFKVSVIRSDAELADYLQRAKDDVIIQQHVPGHEFGVFYYRNPIEATGKIFSITRKLFPSVVGDGVRTLESLILSDKRAVSMAHAYFDAQKDRLLESPAAGERVQLIEIGTHCRGSVFLDGEDIKTEALEAVIDHVAQGFPGFYFGRFDIRTPSIPDFQAGTNFKIVELNGVTSEATNIYDPKNSVFAAYKVLFQQWRIAFEIGAQNRSRGHSPTSIRLLLKLALRSFFKKNERSRPHLRLNSQEVLNS
jgi:membrane protein DedA with SNARE-associated domain